MFPQKQEQARIQQSSNNDEALVAEIDQLDLLKSQNTPVSVVSAAELS